ncbi:MAG TPA: hypothetical protein DEP77_05445 [Bacteroidales bacterium]|nr:hypothetical protein [Bacteroidales bacterium]
MDYMRVMKCRFRNDAKIVFFEPSKCQAGTISTSGRVLLRIGKLCEAYASHSGAITKNPGRSQGSEYSLMQY